MSTLPTVMILANVVPGLLFGVVASLAYFRHLKVSVEKLSSGHLSAGGLLAGAVLRMSLLLLLGWLILRTVGPAGTAGYAVAFLLVRSIEIHRARSWMKRTAGEV